MKVGLILAVIIYEIAVVAIVSIVLKAVEKKKAHTAAVSGDDKDFLLAGRNMGVITLAPTIALTVLFFIMTVQIIISKSNRNVEMPSTVKTKKTNQIQ